jgi:hypothetical protein
VKHFVHGLVPLEFIRRLRGRTEYFFWGLSRPWLQLFLGVSFIVSTMDLGRSVVDGSIKESGLGALPRLTISVLSLYFSLRSFPDSYRRRLVTKLVVQEIDDDFVRSVEYDPDLKLQRVLVGPDVYGVNSNVDEALSAATSQVLLVEIGTPYELVPSVHTYRLLLLKDSTNPSEVLFNGKKVRLATDLVEGPLPAQVRLEKTTFYNSRCTNNSVLKIIRDTHGMTSTPVFDGWNSLVVGTGTIRSLESNEMSNEIGVSTLCFTSDGDLLIIKQGPQNHRNSGYLVPSGSGSLDWKDVERVGPAPSLLDVVLFGSERELREECGVPKDVAIRSQMLGFYRDSMRGGKPEFMSISKVDCAVRDLEDVSATEGGYTSRRIDLHFGVPTRQIEDGALLKRLRLFLIEDVLNGDYFQNNEVSSQLSYHIAVLVCSISGVHLVDLLKSDASFDPSSLERLKSSDVKVTSAVSQFLIKNLVKT